MSTSTRNTVVFSGENPGLGLYKPGTEQLVAGISYWRCVYSEHGEGNAAIVWMDPDGSGLGQRALHGIYTDNPRMARLVTDRFTQHFANYQNRGFESIAPTHARFFQESDSRWYHRVAFNTGDLVVELVWWDVLDYQMVNRQDYQVGPTQWDLATVICPCKSATITVSNVAVQGDVRWTTEGAKPSSSAFLAFSETWVERT
jgi:hypothetical protein